MKTFILKEGVLNDAILLIPDKGKIFKGNYIAVLKYYKFLNSSSNKEYIVKFRSIDRLKKYLNKNYKDSDVYSFIE
jgi:hypothetical protein